MTRAYSEAMVEVLDILEHTEKEKVNLIPKKFIEFLNDNSAKDYAVKLDYSKPINEMNIKRETKGILTTICRNWWWSEDEKREYIRLVKEKEEKHEAELRKKYNPDDLFKNNKRAVVETLVANNASKEAVAITECKKSVLGKFFKWLRSLFKK